jgi:FAD/FMN-containing dehydrogenase
MLDAPPPADLFLAEAARLLGPRGLTRDADLVSPWLTDWRGRFTGRALAMASPADTGEVAALVRLCAAHGVAIVPQGGNSGMCAGATPDGSGAQLLLSLRRLNAIGPVDPAARRVTVGAGAILETLHGAAGAAGLRFPLTLGGKGSATIGGLISTNAGGTQVLRHGTMRDQVLGLEAVMADGSIYSALTPLRKDNRGFDLKQLLIGSEGTLGIVTAATLALVPAVAARTVAWIGVESIRAARELLVRLEQPAGAMALGETLEGFEVMPRHCLDAVLAHLPSARAPLSEPHDWNVLVECVADAGGAAGLRERVEAALAAGLESGLIEDATLAANEAQADAFWRLRDDVAPAERAQGPAMQHDISVPVERMADFVAEAVPAIEARWPGTRAIAFGHLGDGNVHFHVLAPPGVEARGWQENEGVAISEDVYAMVTAWGGSISAEHGIGQLKRAALARHGDPVALAIMTRVKAAVDPQGLLNPGKLLP